MMAKGIIVTRVLPLRFLFLLPDYIHVYTTIIPQFSYLDQRNLLQQEYSQPRKLPSPHFRWVVKYNTNKEINEMRN